jgi:hypothetical protein
MTSALTPKQRELAKKHGTPAQFAVSVYKTVPEFCSMDEAHAAITKYSREWKLAGAKKGK